MIGHDYAVTCIKSIVLCLEEVIGVIEVDTLLPSFSCFLVSLEIRVVSNEDSRLNILSAKATREGGSSPCKIEDITFEILPGISQIFCDVKFFVDFTRLIVGKICARSPSSSKGPGSLLWMVLEFVNSFT
jgi:hypothetical protein